MNLNVQISARNDMDETTVVVRFDIEAPTPDLPSLRVYCILVPTFPPTPYLLWPESILTVLMSSHHLA